MLKFFDVDPRTGMEKKFGSGIWDGKKSDPRSGIKTPRIRNTAHDTPFLLLIELCDIYPDPAS
jgi:hypothetical protein